MECNHTNINVTLANVSVGEFPLIMYNQSIGIVGCMRAGNLLCMGAHRNIKCTPIPITVITVCVLDLLLCVFITTQLFLLIHNFPCQFSLFFF